MDAAFGMFIAFWFVTSWLSPRLKRRVVGYGLAADISCHVILQSMFGGDAAGRLGLLFAGVGINAAMHTYRWLWGYETYTGVWFRGTWTRHPGRFT